MKINEYHNGLHIRSITPVDKNLYMGIRMEASDIYMAYEENPEFADVDWNKTLKSELDHSMVVFNGDSFDHVGVCTFHER